MKLTTLINSVFVVASVAFTSGIASAQSATNNYASATNNGQNTHVNSQARDNNSTNISYIQPFNLVSLAYQGGLKQQGIPSGGTLVSEYQNRNITAKDLVKAAVNANKLPAQVLNEQNYLSAVRSQLSSLSRNFTI
ncbi:hypothetical protein A6770_26860 [Nostoc minutum NIES-26]|uniref:DUF4168 domain-containing protein n=1 Tax=Nostoc minutum NIES-26 TaxID=1844469 RepID=A0A367QS77_9NOSO|nr:hypothetical protein [Dendronalium sp. ChiSLP03b]MDZ8206910.1 hypothetical protein [Dendronalium sp. ChiSLP03b]RCJ26153.1 hypothetical protein A6770_26860 [Nostoc minutum NIES-26]